MRIKTTRKSTGASEAVEKIVPLRPKPGSKSSNAGLTVDDVIARLSIPEGGEAAVRAHVEKELPKLLKQAKSSGQPPEEYVIAQIEAAINEGAISFKDGEGDGNDIIEVSQEELKRALKALLTKRNKVIKMLYRKHEEFNKQYFNGELSLPVITIEKMSNRTLGNYTEGEDASGLRNHIRFNVNFIALNSEERILETLKHEMIHQWQDEILYAPKGETNPTKQVTVLKMGEDGVPRYTTVVQKKRPKEWHNKDFREMAACIGIPAIGAKCYGNPAKMPEAKSYNRKFVCGCVASNGYPVTVWSTRPIDATCNRCGNKFMEVEKTMTKGKVIDISMSHIERPNQDAVMDTMLQKYENFERFETREQRDLFVAGLTGKYETGVYQKNHNAYQKGYRYWVAFNGKHPAKETEKVKDKDKKKPKTKQTAAAEEIGADAQETAAVKDQVSRTYSADNPQDIIDLYRQEGSTRKVAARLGIPQSTLMGRIKKFQIDFNKGTFQLP